MSMTAGQETAYKRICQWFDDKETAVFRLGGPAGSGKSWLIPLIAEHVGMCDCLFMTPTGKAANRLIKSGLDAHTIHSQIYQPKNKIVKSDVSIVDLYKSIKNYKGGDGSDDIYEYELKSPTSFLKYKLFIIDEGSMVGGKLLADILSFNVPVLLVGDPNQLDPVDDTTVFDECDYYLTEIVRQAQDSPIIWLSQQILNGKMPMGTFATCQVRYGGLADAEIMYANQILTDTNATRQDLNTYIRNLWFDGNVGSKVFKEKDKIICRTNSPIESTLGFTLTNGAQGIIKHILSAKMQNSMIECVMSTDELGDFTLKGAVHPERFAPEIRPPKIEHAYAITVHLSQGSEWDNVIYVASKYSRRPNMYTAVTRAKQSVLVTIPTI